MAKLIFTKEDKKFFRELQKRAEKKGKNLEWGCNLIKSGEQIIVDRDLCHIGNHKGMLFQRSTRQTIADIHSHPWTPKPTAYDLLHAIAEGLHFQCVWHALGDKISCVGNLRGKTKGQKGNWKQLANFYADRFFTANKKKRVEIDDRLYKSLRKKLKLKEFSFSK